MVDMKYRILTNKAISKSEMRHEVLKWILYLLCLIVFFMIMRSGAFGAWQPFLIIPLAVAVSLNERELSSCIFALFCGYLIDISCRFIFGFSTVWLMIVCVAASLLSRNLIRVNLLNFFWISCLAVLLEFSMNYLFNVVIWNKSGGDVIFNTSIVPSVVSTVILSPFVFLLVRYINVRFSEAGRHAYRFNETIAEDDEVNNRI